jgi:hypothetical protein
VDANHEDRQRMQGASPRRRASRDGTRCVYGYFERPSNAAHNDDIAHASGWNSIDNVQARNPHLDHEVLDNNIAGMRGQRKGR